MLARRGLLLEPLNYGCARSFAPAAASTARSSSASGRPENDQAGLATASMSDASAGRSDCSSIGRDGSRGGRGLAASGPCPSYLVPLTVPSPKVRGMATADALLVTLVSGK
jgi:hypothetical protein